MESKKEQLITEVVYQGNHTYEIKVIKQFL